MSKYHLNIISFLLKYLFSVRHIKIMNPILLTVQINCEEQMRWSTIMFQEIISGSTNRKYYSMCIYRAHLWGLRVENRCWGSEGSNILQIWQTGGSLGTEQISPFGGCLMLAEVEEVPCISPQHLVLAQGGTEPAHRRAPVWSLRIASREWSTWGKD